MFNLNTAVASLRVFFVFKNVLLNSVLLPVVGGGRCMLDKASLCPQLAGAKRGFEILRDQSYKRIMKYCFIHLQCLQGKEI